MVRIILWINTAENQLHSGGLKMYCPSSYILVTGVGNVKFQLVSFDKALFASKIANYNLVKVSSILPHVSLPIPSELSCVSPPYCVSLLQVTLTALTAVGLLRFMSLC